MSLRTNFVGSGSINDDTGSGSTNVTSELGVDLRAPASGATITCTHHGGDGALGSTVECSFDQPTVLVPH